MTTEADKTMEVLTESKYRQYLIRSLELAEAELGSDIPVSTLLVLLKLNGKGATPMTQVTKSSGLSPAGSSRTISTLAGFAKANRREIKKPYVTMVDDEVDRRYKMIHFTDYGRQFVDRMLSVVY